MDRRCAVNFSDLSTDARVVVGFRGRKTNVEKPNAAVVVGGSVEGLSIGRPNEA